LTKPTESKSLKQRTLHATLWIVTGNFSSQALRFASNLIMTRLLVPDMFGLMAMANVMIFGISLFTDMGLNQSIVQSKRTDMVFINTIWTIQVIRGWFVWFISILMALTLYGLNSFAVWPAGSVYASVTLPYLIVAIGFTSVISEYKSTSLATHSRNLSLNKITTLTLVSQIVGIVVTIIWAYFFRNIWAMVAGSLVSALGMTVGSHLLFLVVKNRYHWDSGVFKEIFHFGKWIFVSSILGFLFAGSDKLLLGGLVDSKTLGFYAIAFFMYSAVRDLFGNVLQNVGFPALSETHRNKPEALKTVFYKLRLPFDSALIFAAGFLFASGDVIVRLLYDQRYESVGWILQILAIGLFEVRYRLAEACYMAIGKPKILSQLRILSLMVLYMGVGIAFHYYGLKGVVWTVTLSALASIPVHIYYLTKLGLFDWKRELLILPLFPFSYFVGQLLVRLFF